MVKIPSQTFILTLIGLSLINFFLSFILEVSTCTMAAITVLFTYLVASGTISTHRLSSACINIRLLSRGYHVVTTRLLQSYVVETGIFRSCIKTLRRKRQPKNRYRIVERACRDDPLWPPAGQLSFASSDVIKTNVDSTAVNMHS